MKQRHHLNKTGISRRQQLGQSMVEYAIVISLGILTISSAPMRDFVDGLMATIHQNYAGYSFALSLSDYPDYADVDLYWNGLVTQNVNEDMRHVLTDKFKKGIGPRTSAKNTTAVEKYQTSSPDSLSGYVVQSKITSEAGTLKNLSIP